MGKVKAQQIGVNLRALLHGMRPEVVLQSGVDQVRGRMGPADGAAPANINLRGDSLPQVEASLAEVAGVEHEAPFPLRVEHLKPAARPGEPACVAHLSARFAIKRSLVEHNGRWSRFAHLAEGFAEAVLGNDADHLAIGLEPVVAEEFRAVHRFFKGVERA